MPRLDSASIEQKPVLYHEWSGMVETHALYRLVGEKKVSYGGVFDLAVEQPLQIGTGSACGIETATFRMLGNHLADAITQGMINC